MIRGIVVKTILMIGSIKMSIIKLQIYLLIFFSLIFSINPYLYAATLNIPQSNNLYYEKKVNLRVKKFPKVKGRLKLLHDGIPSWSENRKSWAVLTDPSGARYDHGILGDSVEATGISVLNRYEKLKFKIVLDNPEVIESRYVIRADTDGDGYPEIYLPSDSYNSIIGVIFKYSSFKRFWEKRLYNTNINSKFIITRNSSGKYYIELKIDKNTREKIKLPD